VSRPRPIRRAVLLGASLMASACRRDVYSSVAVDTLGQLRVVTRSGRVIVPRKEAGQVAFSDPQIAEGSRVVGWLAEFPNCCTSYPVPLAVVTYSNRTTRTYTGVGLAVARWSFEAGGTRVAFRQETVHGGMGVHYELREVATGRLIAQYSPGVGSDNQTLPMLHAPMWVRQLDGEQ
jgi:hypothetical protein